MLSGNQHGARAGRSMLMPLIEQHDYVTDCLCEGENVDLVYMKMVNSTWVYGPRTTTVPHFQGPVQNLPDRTKESRTG